MAKSQIEIQEAGREDEELSRPRGVYLLSSIQIEERSREGRAGQLCHYSRQRVIDRKRQSVGLRGVYLLSSIQIEEKRGGPTELGNCVIIRVDASI